jgi:hypothetical protein
MRKDEQRDFTGLRALFFNGMFTRSPVDSHTDLLIKIAPILCFNLTGGQTYDERARL